MATIDIRRNHTIGKAAARDAAQGIAEKLKDKVDVRYHWDGDDLRFERTGAKGRIQVTESEVRVEIDLNLALRPLRGKLEAKVHKYLDESLG
jgi:putative polyhydroxyalkanoate system protein